MDFTQHISEWGYRQTADTQKWYTANQAPQNPKTPKPLMLSSEYMNLNYNIELGKR